MRPAIYRDLAGSTTDQRDLMNPQKTVAKNTVLLGVLLTILGLGTFALLRLDTSKWTALLPAFFGILFLLLGAIAHKPAVPLRLPLYAALTLALIAALGTSGGLLKITSLLAGNPIERPVAAVEQAVTSLLCVGFLAIVFKSLFDTRRTKMSEGAQAPYAERPPGYRP